MVVVAAAAVAAPRQAGDTAGGRGGGGGGGGRRRRWWPRRRGARDDPSHMAACTTSRVAGVEGGGALWDGFAWGIAPWDTNKVEAALKARGLDPVADHSGNDFRSFHVKDPDGMDVQITNGNKKNRRKGPANGKLNVALPFEPTGWKTMYLDHISYACTSYKETVAFYEALLGWKGLGDEGSQNETQISPEIGGLLIRGGNATAPGFPMPAQRRAVMNHISFGVSPFDADKMWAEMCKRGLQARVDTGAIASSPAKEHDIHTAKYKSFHTRTPNNYDLQFSAKIFGRYEDRPRLRANGWERGGREGDGASEMIARAVVFFFALDFRPIVAARALAHDPLAPTRPLTNKRSGARQ